MAASTADTVPAPPPARPSVLRSSRVHYFLIAAVVACIALFQLNLIRDYATQRARRGTDEPPPTACKKANTVSFTLDGPATNEAFQNHVNLLATVRSSVTVHLPALLSERPVDKIWYREMIRQGHVIGLYWDAYNPKDKSWTDFDASLKNCSMWMKEAAGVYPRFIRMKDAYVSNEAIARARDNGFFVTSFNPDLMARDCILDESTANFQTFYDNFFAGYQKNGGSSVYSFIPRHSMACWSRPSYVFALTSSCAKYNYTIVPLKDCVGLQGEPYNSKPPEYVAGSTASDPANNRLSSNPTSDQNSTSTTANAQKTPSGTTRKTENIGILGLAGVLLLFLLYLMG